MSGLEQIILFFGLLISIGCLLEIAVIFYLLMRHFIDRGDDDGHHG